MVVQERERLAVVQGPPPLVLGQPQRKSALRLGRFCLHTRKPSLRLVQPHRISMHV